MQSNKRDVRKYELYYADLRPVKGSEQGGIRPVLIIQNHHCRDNNLQDKENQTSDTCVPWKKVRASGGINNTV
jgi:hypothetical protein